LTLGAADYLKADDQVISDEKHEDGEGGEDENDD
jgi:hypothetical protein